MKADADRPSYARIERRRAADLAFLDRVRNASIAELRQMAEDLRRGPMWKRVAVARRMATAERNER